MKLLSTILCIFLITPFFSEAEESVFTPTPFFYEPEESVLATEEELKCLNEEMFALEEKAHLLNNPKVNEDFLTMEAKLKSLTEKGVGVIVKYMDGNIGEHLAIVTLNRILVEQSCLFRDFIQRASKEEPVPPFACHVYTCRAQLLN